MSKRVRHVVLVTLLGLAAPPLLGAQENPASVADPTVAETESGGSEVATEAPKSRLPLFLTVGGGYGLRQDACEFCESPLDNKSFTGHASLGKYITDGLAVGVDVSTWKRSRQRARGLVDTTAVDYVEAIAGSLGNASISFSYQVWHVYFRAGGGLAWGSQDLELPNPQTGDVTVSHVSGMGIGYSVGAGIMLPVFSPVSLAFFGNWNVGRYDMSADGAVLARDSEHEYLEVGVGLTLR